MHKEMTSRLRNRPSRQPLTAAAQETAPPDQIQSQSGSFSVPIDKLKPANRRIRRATKSQRQTLMANIERFGCVVSVLVTDQFEIIDGHAIWEACKALGHKAIEVRVVSDLSPAEIKALRISLHAIAELSEFDDPALALDLKFLFKADPLLVTYTALPMARIDSLILGSNTAADPDAGGEAALATLLAKAVTRLGDRWIGDGGHVLYCGDAKDPASYVAALDGKIADMIFSDVPYAIVPIKGVVSSKHESFVEGSGLTEEEADAFFLAALQAMVGFVRDGAIVDLFIDYRAMYSLTGATRAVGLTHLCTVTWNKVTPAMGGLYRHAAEYVLVLKHGKKPHINNVRLGKFGRNRSTVWTYPGMAQFGAGRNEALASHATVKPLGLLVDAILDVTNRGDLVLDPFVGTGSAVLAAHRAGRIGVGIELDPRHVDTAVARLEAETGKPVLHGQTGLTFAQMAERRRSEEGV